MAMVVLPAHIVAFACKLYARDKLDTEVPRQPASEILELYRVVVAALSLSERCAPRDPAIALSPSEFAALRPYLG